MNIKQWTFEAENLPGADVTLDLEYSYSFDPGKLYGPPDDCYPPEEDAEICLPKGWEVEVMLAYIKAGKEAIKAIRDDLVPQLEWEGKPKEWANADAERYADDQGESQYESMREAA